MFSLVVVLTTIVMALANPSINKPEASNKLTKNCSSSYTVTCLKLDLVNFVDKLNENDHYNLLPGVTVVRENATGRANTADIVAELARDFPNDPNARLDAFLLKKVTDYFNSHSVRLNLFSPSEVEGPETETGRQRGGKRRGGGMANMMLAAGAMMKGTLMALALGGIAAIAGKALMTGLISLLLSAIIGLKSLTSQGHKQTTYEIVSKPVYTHSATHSEEHAHGGYGHSSYGRSFDLKAPLPMGLNPDYKPGQ